MAGTVEFFYDAENDVVINISHWRVETEEDCEEWFKQYTDYLKPFDRKMDSVSVLDDLVVSSKVVKEWGEYRTNLVKNYYRFSFRVHFNALVKILVKSDSLKYNAASQDADSVEGAIEGIKAARLAAGIQ
jgi:hypothetical protein